jgi:hypothetical protein
MFVAAISPFILPDFPHNTKRHFTDEEVKVARLRMLEDVSDPTLQPSKCLPVAGWRDRH